MHSLSTPVVLNYKSYLPFLGSRAKNAHKGDFGHVLIIGGYEGYAGAVHLAGEAALRAGAGLVTIATHEAHAATLQAIRPELIVHGTQHLPALLKHATVIVIGPGLGQTDWSHALLDTTLHIKNKPILFDADALNLLPQCNYHAEPYHLYTPHPGEAARLLQKSTADIQQHRLQSLAALTERYSGIVVLKGQNTLIGQLNQPTRMCDAGNPGMATAGMGDLLTGIIAGLIAQHLPLMDAACLGVLIHALAGDQAASAGQRGLIASDLLPHLRSLLNPT